MVESEVEEDEDRGEILYELGKELGKEVMPQILILSMLRERGIFAKNGFTGGINRIYA